MSFSTTHLYFDDLEVGQEWTSGGRTVTEADIVHFAGLSGDFNPIHIDHEFAKTTPFRRPIAHGFGVFSIASGLGVMCPAVRTIALLRVRYWNFILPVFAGDTVRCRSRVVEKTLKYPDFEAADEVFSTGNFSKVVPVTRIGDRSLQPGPMYRKARELYWAFAHAA